MNPGLEDTTMGNVSGRMRTRSVARAVAGLLVAVLLFPLLVVVVWLVGLMRAEASGGVVIAPATPTFSLNTANQDPGDFVLSGFNSSATLDVSIGFVNPPAGTTFSLPTTNGLTPGTGYNFTGGKTQISFTGTQANANAALAAMTVTTGSTKGNITIRVTASVYNANIFYNPINGNYYEFVSGSFTGASADTAARSKSYLNVRGYLVTITSTQEQDFVFNNTTAANIWIGANDVAQEGRWVWGDGPEAGVNFWNGVANGSTPSGRYAKWCSQEPNDWSPGEDYAVTNWGSPRGNCWNDYGAPATSGAGASAGYLVEYSQNWGTVGAFSGIASAEVTALVSNAPRNVTAARANPARPGEIVVSWSAPLGGTVTSYLATSSPGGRTCTVSAPSTTCTVTGLTNGTSYTFTVRATFSDSSTETSLASNSVSPADGLPPVPSVASASVNTGSSVTVNITLDEASTDFTIADLSATLGTLSNFSGSGASYSVVFTPFTSSGGTGTVTVNSGTFRDVAGNFNNAPATGSITITNTVASTGGRTSFAGNSASISGTSTGSNYIVERFTTSAQWTVPRGVTSVDVLAVGGGGGGGSRGAGGGGAGGFVEASGVSVVPGATVNVVVGGGGSGGASSTSTSGSAGSSSSFLGVTANGGSGGSVHGSGAWGGSSGTGSGGTSYSNSGGRGLESSQCGSSDWCGGGGGGAGTAGSSAVSSGGAGGNGRASSITGTSVTYAGGGGGGGGSSGTPSSTPTAGGAGGSGGGGSGGTPVWNGSSCTVTDGASGTASLGGGGGGSSYCDISASATGQGAGGSGGSGVVIVRYVLPNVSAPVLATGSNSGDTSDNRTRFTSVTMSGSAPVGSIVQLSTAPTGTSTWTSTGSTCTADSLTGEWNCTTGTLAPGTYDVRAVSTTHLDGGVTQTQTSSTLSALVIDTTAPASSASITATHTNSSSVSVSYTVSDTVAVDSLEVFRSTNADLSGAVSCGSATGLSGLSASGTVVCTGMSFDNTFYVYTVATDSAGNVEAAPGSADDSVVRDTVAPSTPSAPSLDSSSDTGSSTSDRLTKDTTPTFTTTIGETGGTVTFTTSLGATCVLSSVSTTSPSCTFTTLAGGTHTVTVVHTDRAGNASTISSSTSITIDFTAPTVSTFASSNSTSPTRAFDLTLTFDASVTGLASGDITNAGTAGTCTFIPNASTGSTFTVTATCAQDGTVIARLSGGAVEDQAGNAGPSASFDSSTVTISSAPTRLAVVTAPSGAASGSAFATQPVIELRNGAGQTIVGTAATVQAAVTQVSGSGVLVGTTTATVDTSTGRATFTSLGLTGTAGTSYTLTFSSTVSGTALTPATGSVTVSVGAATRLAVAAQPTGAGAGAALASQPVIQVWDSGGNLVTSSTASITVTASGGTLGGTTTVLATSGVATFTDLSFAGTAGTNYTLSFSSSGLAQTTSSNFSVTVGAPTKIVLTTTATGARYSQVFTTQPVVEIQDAGSNRVASSAVVTATLSGGVVVGTNQSTLDETAANGVATFSGLGIVATPGPYTVSYSSPGLTGTSQGITVLKAQQTITFGALADVTYSSSPLTIGATTSSGLAVSFSSLTGTTCSVAGNAVTMLSSGPCTITADHSGDANHEPASSVSRSFTIARATPTFTWSDVSKTFGDPSFQVTPPVSSVSGSFVYASSDPNVVTVADDVLSVTGGGSATITARFTPDDPGKYESGGVVTMVVSVDRSTQQPILLTSINGTYGDALDLAVQGGSTNGALSFQVVDGTATGCAEVGGDLVSTSKGTCVVTATMAADQDYLSVTTQPTIVTLGARPITVEAEDESRRYGDDDPVLAYSVTSGSLVIGDVLSGSLSREVGEDVGSYGIGRGSLDDPNYDISFVPGRFEITRRAVTVTVDVSSKRYGDPDPSFSFAITNGDLVVGDTLTGVLERSSGETVGSYPVTQGTLTNANNPNYAITFVSRDLIIERRPILVSAVAVSKKYSTADPVLTYTTQNVVAGDQLVGVLDRAPGEDVGDHAIGQGTVDNSRNPNYDISFVGANLNIYARPITVTADPQRITYGDPDPVFTYVVGGDGLKNGDSLSGSLARVAGTNVGDHVITRGSLDNPNYSIEFFGSYLTIEPKPITVRANDLTITYGDPEPTLTFAPGTNDLVGNDQLSGSPVREAGSDAGIYGITEGSVTSANNPNYDITFVSGTLTIRQAAQTPLVISSTEQIYGVDLTLTYTGGSGDGSTTFSIDDPGTAGCSVTGELLSSTGGVGSTCVVRLTKAASLNFLERSVSATITIEPREITVTADSPLKTYGDVDPVFTYTITEGSLVDGDVLTGGMGRLPGEDVGQYVIGQGTFGHPDYVIDFVPGTLTIQPRPITVAARDLGKTAGDLDPVFTFDVSEGSLVGSDQLAGSPERTPGELIGTYAINRGTVDATWNPNYDITFVPGVFTINGQTQAAMTLVADSTTIVRGEIVELSVIGGDGSGAVSYAVVGEAPVGACSLVVDSSTSSAELTGLLAGSCVIVADKASDGTFEATRSQVLTITVEKQSQTITFVTPGDMDYSSASFLVDPRSDSGLSVGVRSTTTSVCTVDGFRVQLLFRGECELVASVDESANYLAADDVTVRFEVSAVLPAAPVISALTATSDSIAVTFDAGDHGGEVITGYEYSLDGGVTWLEFPVGSVTSPIVISGTSASTQYAVMLRAVTSIGAGPSSNEMSVSTPAPPQSQIIGGASTTTSSVVTTTSSTTTTVVTTSTVSTSPSSTGVSTTVVRTTVTETTRVDVERATVTTQRSTTRVTDGSSTPPGADSNDPGADTPVAPQAIDVLPGDSVVVRDDEAVDVVWTPLEDGGATTTWGDVELTIAATTEGTKDPLLPDGTIAIEQGSTIMIDANGLQGSTPVEGWLFSEPTFLGMRDVDSSGRLTTSFDVPRSIGVGSHTLKLVMTEDDGTIAQMAIGVMVLDTPAATANRAGELPTSVADLLTSPTVTGFVRVDSSDASMIALWLLLILLLVASVGRLAPISPRRMVPDFLSAVVDDAAWLRRLRLVRWLLPMVGFVLGAWASASTGALPVPPITLLMLTLLVLGALDPFSGLVAGVSYATGVIVGGGLTSWSGVVSLLIVVALWSAPGLAGSAVSRLVDSRILVASAVVRATVATAMTVALIENLPVHTSVVSTTNLYVTEFAWLLAIASLVRSWLDHSLDSNDARAHFPARRNSLMTGVGLVIVAAIGFDREIRSVWSVLAVLLLVAVVSWRLRFEARIRSAPIAGWVAVGVALIVGVAALRSGESNLDRIESSDPVRTAVTSGTALSSVVVDVDSYPYVFDSAVLPDQRVIVMNEDLDVHLTVSSVLSDGGVVPVGDDRLLLVIGQAVEIRGEGLAAGSPIDAWLFSTPQQLGVGSASSQGRIDATFPVPDDQPIGSHDLRIRVTLADGQSALVTLPVSVLATAPGQSF